MPFKRYCEIGRVAMVNYGDDYGKLYVISDVVDQKRVLVDCADEVRKVFAIKRLTLTDIKLDLPRLVKKSVLVKTLADEDVQNKFNASKWGAKVVKQKAKAEMNDFDRFKASVAKSKKNKAVAKVFESLKAKA